MQYIICYYILFLLLVWILKHLVLLGHYFRFKTNWIKNLGLDIINSLIIIVVLMKAILHVIVVENLMSFMSMRLLLLISAWPGFHKCLSFWCV